MSELIAGDTVLYVNGGLILRIDDIDDNGLHTLVEYDTDEVFVIPQAEFDENYILYTGEE